MPPPFCFQAMGEEESSGGKETCLAANALSYYQPRPRVGGRCGCPRAPSASEERGSASLRDLCMRVGLGEDGRDVRWSVRWRRSNGRGLRALLGLCALGIMGMQKLCTRQLSAWGRSASAAWMGLWRRKAAYYAATTQSSLEAVHVPRVCIAELAHVYEPPIRVHLACV
jgi:hypothetical protein